MPLRHAEGDGNTTVGAFHPLDVAHYVVQSPCVDETPRTDTSANGDPASGTKPMNGVKHDGRTRYGAACRLRFTTKRCRKIGFVQAKKRRVSVKRPGASRWSELQPPGERYRLDIEPDAETPLYPYTAPVPDGQEMTDTPGVDDPWGKFKVDDKEYQLPEGSTLRIEWWFKSWVICLDHSPPVTILGHFTWTLVVELTVGKGAKDTKGTETISDPDWTDDPDQKEYEHVVNETPGGGGKAYLP
jgi:hypothetical protein